MARTGRSQTFKQSFRTSRSQAFRVPWDGPCWGETPIERLPIWVTKSDELLDRADVIAAAGQPVPHRSFRNLIRDLRGLRQNPRKDYVFFTVIALLAITYNTDCACSSDGCNCGSSTRQRTDLDVLLFVVIHREGLVHYPFECAELPGRVRFHITAIGRSPPIAS